MTAPEHARPAAIWRGSRVWPERYAAQEGLTRQVLAAAEAADDHETTLVALSSLFAAAAVRGNFDDAWSASRRLVETAKVL